MISKSASKYTTYYCWCFRNTTWYLWNPLKDGILYHINWLAAGFLNHQQYLHGSSVRSPKDTDMRIVGDLNPIFQHGANLREPGRRSQPLGFMGIGMVQYIYLLIYHRHQLNVGKCLRWWFLKYFLEFSSRKLGKWSKLTSILLRWIGPTTN